MKTLLHFKDVKGEKLYVGDVVYRIDYNQLSLGVIGKISKEGNLMIATDYIRYEGGRRMNYLNRGWLLKFNSSKIIKVNRRSLTNEQEEIVQRLLKHI